MPPLADRFFISLPGVPSALSLPCEPWSAAEQQAESEEEAAAAYLQGLPALPDFLLHISYCHPLTKAERPCVSRFIAKLARRIRKARTQWETATSAVVDSL